MYGLMGKIGHAHQTHREQVGITGVSSHHQETRGVGQMIVILLEVTTKGVGLSAITVMSLGISWRTVQTVEVRVGVLIMDPSLIVIDRTAIIVIYSAT
jgi:hypothetical protein